MIGHGSKKGMTCAKLESMRDTNKVVTDYNGCAYITAGKEYDLIDGKWIVDDVDRTISIIEPPNHFPCAHLDEIGIWRHPLRT